jgi:ferric-dicitrate binding protein FerR (iron transport regulator)
MNYETYAVDDFLMNDRFLAYCQGSDPAAVTFWETWQAARPPNIAAFREAERLCKLLNGQKPRLDTSLQELEFLIAGQRQPAKVLPMPIRSVVSFPWWSVAATLLLVSGLGWAGYWFWGNQYVSYETAYNQQRTVQLPDGSSVTLNSHSTLRHKRNGFSGSERAVELNGEGYFSVRHLTDNAPFRVKTNSAFDVQVLGTEFSVYSRPALHRVVLNSGRVQVHFKDNRSPIVLRPGQLLELDDSTRRIRQRTVRADQYNAWLRNQLVFDNTSLPDVIKTIEEQFGVRVRINGTDLDQRTVTGILPISKAETVLDALAELTQLKVRKTKNTFILSKK